MEKILRHPRLIVLVTIVITIFFAAWLPKIQYDNNNLRFVPSNDEQRLTSAWIDETFGSSLFILVGLERPSGEIFDPEFLALMKTFKDEVSEIEIVDDVVSLMNTEYITGDEEYIIVEDLVDEDFEGTPEEIEILKTKLLSWDMYRNALISDDMKSAQIMVSLNVSEEDERDPETEKSFLVIRDMARSIFGDYANVYVTGIPIVSSTVNEAMNADLIQLIPIVILVILIIVYIPLRNFYFVALSLLAVLLSAVWAMGAMPLFGVEMSILITVLPVILIAVGNSYSLHVVIHYIETSEVDFDNMDKNAHTQYVISLMKKVTPAIFLAAITTFVSFCSFCFTAIVPIREFGIFSAFGVFISFVLAITLTPAILILSGPKMLKKVSSIYRARLSKQKNKTAMNDIIANGLVHVTNKHKTVVFVTIILSACSIYGASKLIVDNIFVEYFKETTDIVRSDNFIRQHFGGSKVISIVAEADTPEELLHPDSLSALDGLNKYINKNDDSVGKTMGFTDLIKRTNQVFYNGDESFYEIPTDPLRYNKEDKDGLQRLISNYLFFLSGSITDYANDPLEPTAVKTTVQLRTQGQIDTYAVMNKINKYVAEEFPKNIKVTVGGGALVEGSINARVVQSVWTSMIIAAVSLFIILAVFNKSFAAGCIAVFPLAVLVLFNFGLMGVLGIKLNIGTAMIFSLTMGIGIDYTVHVLEAFKRERSLFSVYRTSGIAIITDAFSTGMGFAVLLFSEFVMLAEFGMLVAASLVMSAIVGLILIPVLINWIKPKYLFKKER